MSGVGRGTWSTSMWLVLALGCGGSEEASGAGNDNASACTSSDPCGGRTRADGERCREIYDLCSRTFVACPCGPSSTCSADGVCVGGAATNDHAHGHDGVVEGNLEDDVEVVHRGCDPVSPCQGAAPEGGPCGPRSAGCPGVMVDCTCAEGLACVEGTCARAGAPSGSGASGAPCRADADHCCLADGTLVRPGGCEPIYPPGVRPATIRNPDGTCQRIACGLRCLPETARIDAPGGAILVTALRVGDVVYTRDASGTRVEAPVVRVGAVPVVAAHAMVELVLADGRVARASAAHPVARDGITFGELAVGDRLDGARIVAARTVPYDGSHTWDLLPAGETGTYWADGVLVGSTL